MSPLTDATLTFAIHLGDSLNNESKSPFEDEIDLREIAQTLWRKRWIILVVTLIAPLIVLIHSFTVPNQYQASASILLRAPIMKLSGNTGNGIDIFQTLPDINSIMALANATETLEKTLENPDLAAIKNLKPLSASNLDNMATITMIGKDQLRLQVTDINPQRAALLSNAWAQQVVVTINDTYGMGALSSSLDEQITLAQQSFGKAQIALQDELSKNRIDELNAQLLGKQDSFNCLSAKIRQTSDIVDDLSLMKQRLEALPKDSILSLADNLALTTLQQRALSGRICTLDAQALTLQVTYDSKGDSTPASALASISQIQNALQTWQSNATAQQTQFEQGIPQLQQSIETAKTQIKQLSDIRDQYNNLYLSLKLQQNLINVAQIDGNKIAAQSILAVSSNVDVLQDTLRNMILAGMVGLTLALIWVFLQDWWQKSNAQKLKNNQVTPKE